MYAEQNSVDHNSKVQIDSLDLTKFLLSIMVVAIHTEFLGQWRFPITRIAVPIFFLISSYFYFHKNRTYSRETLRHFCKRNLQLYLFWFVVLLPVTIYARRYFFSGFLRGCWQLIRDLLLGSTFAASWYIMAQLIAIAILALSATRIRNSVLLTLSAFLYVICLLSSSYYGLIVDTPLQKIFDSLFAVVFPPNSCVVAFFWCSIGKAIADKNENLDRDKGLLVKKKIVFAIVCAASVVCLVLEHLCIRFWIGNSKANDLYIFLIPVCVSAFYLLLHCTCHIKSASKLRKISTIVYCVHCSIAWIVSRFLGLFVKDIYGILCFFLTLALSWLVALVILLLNKKIGILRYAF